MAGNEDDLEPEKLNVQLTDMNKAIEGSSQAEDDEPETIHLRVYARRWLILTVVALLNNTNTMSWIAFAPVSNYVNSFYGENSAAWFSMVYMMCTIPVGFFAMWTGRRFGLRSAILIAGWTNGIGGLVRLSSSFVPPKYRFPIGITGQAIAAIAYPFIMFLPTKVAGSWFPDTQRGLATTVGVMSNPLGVLLANIISPQMVRSPQHVMYLNIFTFVTSVVAMILATVGVNRSEPKVPPTFSASKPQMDFIPGLKACMMSKQYLILFFVMGGGIGMFNCLYTIMQELLCPSGYSNSFVGICAALMIVGGIIGAAGSGIFVDRTKMYEETMKLTLHTDLVPFLAITCVLFGIFGLATYPVGLELSAECTFPVSEATSTGLIVLSGQVQSVLYVLIMKQFARPLKPERMDVQVCSVDASDTLNQPKDNTQAVMVFSLLAALLVLILVIFFKPTYRRIETEKENRAQVDKEKRSRMDNRKITLPCEAVTQPLNNAQNI
ncbi:transporter, major facilitator family protein [Dictyocaulus viviparus]|uniref:Transporter, major facilitator family protein n=1 Tax=Dictyocaulus viviparus TaxID=29172 RepID=A0A0D8XEY0_DICVI|nr:transporter, major facilitator family protein [Dictyocaulus viviparus]